MLNVLVFIYIRKGRFLKVVSVFCKSGHIKKSEILRRISDFIFLKIINDINFLSFFVFHERQLPLIRRQMSINNTAKVQKRIDIYKYKKAKSILFHNRMPLFFLKIILNISIIKFQKVKTPIFANKCFCILQFNL